MHVRTSLADVVGEKSIYFHKSSITSFRLVLSSNVQICCSMKTQEK